MDRTALGQGFLTEPEGLAVGADAFAKGSRGGRERWGHARTTPYVPSNNVQSTNVPCFGVPIVCVLV